MTHNLPSCVDSIFDISLFLQEARQIIETCSFASTCRKSTRRNSWTSCSTSSKNRKEVSFYSSLHYQVKIAKAMTTMMILRLCDNFLGDSEKKPIFKSDDDFAVYWFQKGLKERFIDLKSKKWFKKWFKKKKSSCLITRAFTVSLIDFFSKNNQSLVLKIILFVKILVFQFHSLCQ